MKTLALLVFAKTACTQVLPFQPTTTVDVPKRCSFSSRCWAKKTRRSKQQASRGGGFGTKTKEKSTVAIDDYSVFPRLEPDVLSTLTPAYPDSGPYEVSEEVYHRLGQIYGFDHFNYESKKEEQTSSVLDMLSDAATATTSSSSAPSSSTLDDLLGSSSSTATTTSSTGSLDLDSLLASATGGAAPKLNSSPTTNTIENLQNSLDKIPHFQNVQVLHMDPMVLSIDDFFTPEECDRYISASQSTTLKRKGEIMESRSPTVGKDAAAKAQRTSTTWYHCYENVPELVGKASRLLGLNSIHRWEEPQTVRYRRNEKFTWHLDALGPTENQETKGGQRIATLLVYLTDLGESDGGATVFRDLGGTAKNDDPAPLKVQPKQGRALLFFPSAGGIPNTPIDIRTLHSGEVVAASAECDKWISQLWLREKAYSPTAPPGNNHRGGIDAIKAYCESFV